MNKLIASLQGWWSSITPREQKLMTLGTILLVVGGLYWGIVQPVSERAQNAQMRIQSEKQLLAWVENRADDIIALRQAGGKSVSSLPLNQAISSTATRFDIELVRVQARGEEYQVWISPVAFNKFVDWIAFLQESHGVGVVFLDLDRSNTQGMVEVKRLQFSKG